MTKPLDRTLFNKCIQGFGMEDSTETQSYFKSPSNGGADAHDMQGAAAETISQPPLERKLKTSAKLPTRAKPNSATVNHVCVGSDEGQDLQTPHAVQHQTYTVLLPGLPRQNNRC